MLPYSTHTAFLTRRALTGFENAVRVRVNQYPTAVVKHDGIQFPTIFVIDARKFGVVKTWSKDLDDGVVLVPSMCITKQIIHFTTSEYLANTVGKKINHGTTRNMAANRHIE